MLVADRKSNKQMWFGIIKDWENSNLQPSVYCLKNNLILKRFYRYRSLYVQSKLPKIDEFPPTSLIPVKISSDTQSIPKVPIEKNITPSTTVEIELPKLSIHTNDTVNIDFMFGLITRLTGC